MAICVSCRRKADPNRSFCWSCGSSVFVDANDPQAVPHFDPAPTSLSSVDTHQSAPRPSRQRQRVDVARKVSELARKKATASTARAGAGCVTGLLRLGIFIAVIYYGGRWFLSLPEIASLKEAVQRNEVSDDTVQATIDGLRRRVERLFGNTSETSDVSPAPAQQEPNAARPPAATATEVPFAPGERLPPGVYLPGNGVTMPRLLRQVNPAYTARARRARIQGPVIVRGVVQIDGGITDVAVVQSLDSQYGLDEAAVRAVQQWQFAPGERGGEAVPVMVRITVNFTMPP